MIYVTLVIYDKNSPIYDGIHADVQTGIHFRTQKKIEISTPSGNLSHIENTQFHILGIRDFLMPFSCKT